MVSWMRGRVKRFVAWLLLLTSLGGCSAPEVVVTVADETVYEQQAMLYLALTLQAYEEQAGKEIWNMRIGGMDAFDAACEAALESMIRNKTVLSRRHSTQTTLISNQEEIEQAASNLRDRIGAETLDEWGITQEQVIACIEEDYRVYQALQQISYLPDTDEIEERVDEYFVWYDHVDVDEYMERIWLDAIIVYTGQFMDGEWIQATGNGAYEKAEEAMAALEAGASFDEVKQQYNEEENLATAPCFTAGVVQSQSGNFFYKGQLERDLWEELFRIPVGQTSDVLTTEYGYLIVRVIGFPGAEENDRVLYQRKLEEVREEYRQQISQEMIQEGLESTIDQWRQELSVTVHMEKWQQIMEIMQHWIGVE
jgi:hypothetical protein